MKLILILQSHSRAKQLRNNTKIDILHIAISIAIRKALIKIPTTSHTKNIPSSKANTANMDLIKLTKIEAITKTSMNMNNMINTPIKKVNSREGLLMRSSSK